MTISPSTYFWLSRILQSLLYFFSISSVNFYFLLPISRESIVLGSNFQREDFDGFTFGGPLNPKITFLLLSLTYK